MIVRTSKINSDILAASRQLKVIVKHGVGYDKIDIQTAAQLGIPVLYTPKGNYESVAEHTLALIFALSKKLNLLDNEIKIKHTWPKNKYLLDELQDKCLGLAGMGRIGSRLIQLVFPLRMKILVYDPFISEKDFPQGIKKVKTLKEILQKSDIVSIHCPLTEETYHLLNEEELKNMKSTAYLINTARGAIVDEVALIKVLKKRLIAGAGLDVFEKEPLSINNPLLSLDNVILTPHIGGSNQKSLISMGLTAIKLAFQILDGKDEEIDPDFFINPAVKGKK